MEAASFCGGVRHKRYSGQQVLAPEYVRIIGVMVYKFSHFVTFIFLYVPDQHRWLGCFELSEQKLVFRFRNEIVAGLDNRLL